MINMIKNFIEKKIAEYQRELAWYKIKTAIGKILRTLLGVVVVAGVVYFLGMHHEVIAAWLKGEELPEAPEGCWWKG